MVTGLQVHGAEIATHGGPQRPSPFAEPGSPNPEADGHVLGGDRLAGLVYVADCLPVALSGPGGTAILHCGWRGLAAGIIARGAAAVRARAAAIGPGIGPCCYEVGDEVLEAFAALGPGIAAGRMLDLPEVARRLLAEAGVEEVESAGLCTSCEAELFFSHRRDRGDHGPPGGPRLDERRGGLSVAGADQRARGRRRSPPTSSGSARRRGEGVEILAATKYVPIEEMGALAEAGVTLVGENRQQDLSAKQERWGDAFEWDFIGNLQSRKVKLLLPRCRLIHSVASDSVLAQLGRHGDERTEVLVEVNVAGEEGKGGSRPRRARRLHRAMPGPGRRPDGDASVQRGSRGLEAPFRQAGRAGRRARAGPALDGDLAGLAGGGGGGSDDHPPRHRAVCLIGRRGVSAGTGMSGGEAAASDSRLPARFGARQDELTRAGRGIIW